MDCIFHKTIKTDTYTNQPIDLTYYGYNRDLMAEKKDFEFKVNVPKTGQILSEKTQLDFQECKRTASASWSFTPTVAGRYAFHSIIGNNEGGSEAFSGFLIEDYVDSPLKQFKSGIASDKIQCKESLTRVTKYDGSPACVKTSHLARLLASGWYPVVPAPKVIRPLVTVLKDKDETDLGFELIKLASTSKGRSFGPRDSFGQPTVIYDEHSLTSTLYRGNSSDGTIIVTKVTDIGSKNVTLTHVLISGSIVTSKDSILTILYADAVGCSVEHFENENETDTCPYPTSIHNPVTLSPGESLIAYFSGDFKIGTVPITEFSPAIYYNIETTGRSDYLMELDVPVFTTVK